MSLTTDSSQHGDLHEGWSQQESASPHVPGDLSGGIRQTSFAARARATSDLLIGTEIGGDGPFDTTGNVLDVILVGDDVSTSTYDVDSRFLPVRSFPPVASGYPEAAIGLACRMLGDAARVDVPWESRGTVHAYYPLRGFQQGFELGSGAPYRQGTWGRAVTVDGSSTASWYWGEHAIPVFDWIRFQQGVYAYSARPLWAPVITGAGCNYVHMRVRLNASSSVSVKWRLQWPGLPDTQLNVRVNRLSGTTGSIDSWGEYRQHNAGATTTIAQTTTAQTGVDFSGEVAFVVQWGWLTDQPDGTLRVKAYAYDPANPPVGAPPTPHQRDFTNAARAEMVSNSTEISKSLGTIVGFRDVVLSQAPASLHSSWFYPVIPESALVSTGFAKTNTATAPPTPEASFMRPVPAWAGSGWDYLKHLVAAHSLQMGVIGGKLHFTDLGGTPKQIRDATTPPQLSIKATGRARTVDVVAHVTEVSRTFAPPANHVIKSSIPVVVDEEHTATFALPPGEHLAGMVQVVMIDRNGLDVPWGNAHSRGARVVPIVHGGDLTLTIRGPRDAVGLGEGPWKITTVHVSNQGFFERPETVSMITAASDEMVTREKGGTVQNPHLTTMGMAYEQGAWAASQAGDPEQTLTFTVPAARRGDYLPGTLVEFGYCVYRCMDVKHDRASVTVTAHKYVTVAMRDAVWAGRTVAEHDAWAAGLGRRNLDARVRPLQTITPGGPFYRVYPSELEYGA